MIQILAVGLVLYPSLLIGSAFTANGEPRISALLSVVQALTLTPALAIGYVLFGTVGCLWAVAELWVLPIFAIGIVAGEVGLVLGKAFGFASS
jgi:hypothetical protein